MTIRSRNFATYNSFKFLCKVVKQCLDEVHSQLRTIWYRYDCAYILSHLCLSTCTMYVNKLQSGTEMFTNMLQNEATF